MTYLIMLVPTQVANWALSSHPYVELAVQLAGMFTIIWFIVWPLCYGICFVVGSMMAGIEEIVLRIMERSRRSPTELMYTNRLKYDPTLSEDRSSLPAPRVALAPVLDGASSGPRNSHAAAVRPPPPPPLPRPCLPRSARSRSPYGRSARL